MNPGIFFQTIRNYVDLSVDAEQDWARLARHRDIAEFYIRYLEQHWLIEKEPFEISLRHDEAKTRYDEFLHKYPDLVNRLKKHHIAAYLGITPTQLSRIFFANK